jgi:signal transduction histidine kinase
LLDAGAEVEIHTVRSIADEGPGIAAEDHRRVFQRFWRGKGASTGGAGLGLAIVKEIADAHHATLSIDDNPSGQGTIFTVRFLSAVRSREATVAEAAST